MVTIKDIAEKAGVSFSTVSKALRDSPLVKPKTKQHILEIAAKLGYQPNLAARSLVSRKSGAIGVVWPSIERAALSSLITRLNGELEKHGYVTLLSISHIEAAIETFRKYQVDAILVFGDRDDSRGETGSQLQQIPILTYGAAGYTSHSAVDVNRGQSVRLAIRHLAELGHQAVAYIGEPRTHDPLQAVKIQAFYEEISQLGLHPDGCPVLPMEGLEFHDGYTAARAMLDREIRPTAVISGGIDLTRGIVRAIQERGLSVPQDISVVSYDNLPEMAELEIPMTSVGVAISDITSVIASTILELIDEPEAVKTVHLEPELVVRDSTCAPSKKGESG
ncbi:LacI family DNA-binding transcriptional regulator [Paenibacillus sp. N4]|uniref:LacI family DNA-binding transcriptional regulator n=1 Tax=Paenibacillus vietnamensis TaxID=2590547 RepID=UPI001CD16F0F|nr:LacI family DNA-binding transcriptional regulator [Paenibacillus vietnamensis]MCA0753590.1 LacI family DNA-binding transcriptional regulator [Paenibacillus vietnamensis]